MRDDGQVYPFSASPILGYNTQLTLVLKWLQIITEYCFGQSHNWLDKPGFNEKFIEMMSSVHEMAAAAKQLNFMVLVDLLPDSFVEKQDAGMASFIQFRRVLLAGKVPNPGLQFLD